MKTLSWSRTPTCRIFAVGILVASATACFDNPTIVRTPIGVTFAAASLPVTPSSVEILGNRDSVVVTIIQPNRCGYQQGASAALDGSTLDVTLTFAAPGPIPCLPTNGSTQFRITVGPLTSGSYLIQAHVRTTFPNDINDTIVGQGTVQLST